MLDNHSPEAIELLRKWKQPLPAGAIRKVEIQDAKKSGRSPEQIKDMLAAQKIRERIP